MGAHRAHRPTSGDWHSLTVEVNKNDNKSCSDTFVYGSGVTREEQRRQITIWPKMARRRAVRRRTDVTGRRTVGVQTPHNLLAGRRKLTCGGLPAGPPRGLRPAGDERGTPGWRVTADAFGAQIRLWDSVRAGARETLATRGDLAAAEAQPCRREAFDARQP